MDRPDTNVVVLGWAQDYLRHLLAHKTPDSLLATVWDEFYRVYNELVRRFAHAQGLRGSDLEDCVQSVWMEVVSSLVDFEPSGSQVGLRSWLYKIVRSKASDILRRRQRHPEQSLESARRAGREPQSVDPDPAMLADRQWEQALVETLLDELREDISEINWRLLQLRCVEGREVDDVAAQLELSAEQVWYRQHRLMKKLRARAAVFTGDSFGGRKRVAAAG